MHQMQPHRPTPIPLLRYSGRQNKIKSFAVPPFHGVYRCIVSPFPAERLSTLRSFPFMSATPQIAMHAERSCHGELWGQERRLFLRTVDAIGLSQALACQNALCYFRSLIRESGSGTDARELKWTNRQQTYTISVFPFHHSNAVER